MNDWQGRCLKAEAERDAIAPGIVADLDRMHSVCEYPEVRAFIPLLIDRIEHGDWKDGAR